MLDPRTNQHNEKLAKEIGRIYGSEAAEEQYRRITEAFRHFVEAFPNEKHADAGLFSAPGRTELGGNHTDHNNGRVLAGSVQLDTIGWAVQCSDRKIEIVSEGYAERIVVGIDEAALAPRVEERETPAALVRGVAAGIARGVDSGSNKGNRIGGFRAYVTSDVLPGSGLSSSASFEVLMASILDDFYNGGALGPVFRAKVGQFAENNFFGKPSGLMDQLACALGGVAAIDFGAEDGDEWPAIRSVTVDFQAAGFVLCTVDTGGSHAELTADYAAVPQEMKEVAMALGGETLADTDRQTLLSRVPALRTHVGDRAILRALHYFNENERVERQFELLRRKEIGRYLEEVRLSGYSSWRLLQNYAPSSAPQEQGIALAAALAEEFFAQAGAVAGGQSGAGSGGGLDGLGAARVHGGGFAGTIQAYVPSERYSDFDEAMSRWFGEGAATPLRIRNTGAVRIA